MFSHRIERVSDEIKRALGEIFIRERPVENAGFVTIMRVVCSHDLKFAKVYVSIYDKDPNSRREKLNGIKRGAPRIRKSLSDSVDIKYIPKLIFYEDKSLEYVERIEEMIKQIHDKENR